VIDKVAEIRVTVMGNSVFAWASRPEADFEHRIIDWRFQRGRLELQAYSLAPVLKEKLFTALERLGLVHGCFDIAVDASGSHIFLKVNPGGQFFSGDRLGGINQLDAFAKFLVEKNPKFKYDNKNSVSLQDFEHTYDYKSAVLEEKAKHKGDVLRHHYGQLAHDLTSASRD